MRFPEPETTPPRLVPPIFEALENLNPVGEQVTAVLGTLEFVVNISASGDERPVALVGFDGEELLSSEDKRGGDASSGGETKRSGMLRELNDSDVSGSL